MLDYSVSKPGREGGRPSYFLGTSVERLEGSTPFPGTKEFEMAKKLTLTRNDLYEEVILATGVEIKEIHSEIVDSGRVNSAGGQGNDFNNLGALPQW